MLIERKENISGAILAGGENKRFGGINKSNIVIGDTTVISEIIGTISDIFSEIFIITNTPEEFKDFSNIKIETDHIRLAGPLGGIHSALKASSNDSVFIFAGDMPFIDRDLIISQIRYFSLSQAEAVVPRIEGNIEPLHAIYRKTIFDRLNNHLKDRNNFSVRDFLQNIIVDYMDLHSSEKVKRAFTNINTPPDAEKAARSLSH